MRVDVAMVATNTKRSGRVLKLVLFRASGELVKIWRGRDRKPDTIKVRAQTSRIRSDWKEVGV